MRQWVLFRGDSHGGFYFIDPSGRAASGKGAILLPDRSVAVTDVEHDLRVLRRAVAGCGVARTG